MDVRMPVMDGIEATRQITSGRGAGGPRVLILTTFDLDEYVFDALRAGASGFALKSRPLEELLSAIRTVAAGEALLAPSVTRRLIAHFTDRGRVPARARQGLDELTEREREVLSLVAQGLSNAELAADAAREPAHRQDPREPDPHQARCPRPHAARHPRLSVGAGQGTVNIYL